MGIDLKKRPYLTYALILVCMVVFGIEVYLSYVNGVDFTEKIISDYGFSLNNLLDGKWWVFFTSIFLHGSAEHLILNMIALYFFAKVVEEDLGWKKLLLIFLGTGIAGNLAVIAMNILGLMPAVPVIGASAAIFGIMGVAMIAKPFEMVFYPYMIPVPLILVALLYSLYNIGAFVLTTVLQQETDIAYMAHLGGLALGMLIGFKQEGPKKGLLVVIVILALLIIIPLFWGLFQLLESTNWITPMTSLVK